MLCLERTKHLDLRSAVRWCELVFLVSINLDDWYLHGFLKARRSHSINRESFKVGHVLND